MQVIEHKLIKPSVDFHTAMVLKNIIHNLILPKDSTGTLPYRKKKSIFRAIQDRFVLFSGHSKALEAITLHIPIIF